MLAAIEFMRVLRIDYTPWSHSLIGAAPFSPAVWRFVVPFAVGMFVLES